MATAIAPPGKAGPATVGLHATIARSVRAVHRADIARVPRKPGLKTTAWREIRIAEAPIDGRLAMIVGTRRQDATRGKAAPIVVGKKAGNARGEIDPEMTDREETALREGVDTTAHRTTHVPTVLSTIDPVPPIDPVPIAPDPIVRSTTVLERIVRDTESRRAVTTGAAPIARGIVDRVTVALNTVALNTVARDTAPRDTVPRDMALRSAIKTVGADRTGPDRIVRNTTPEGKADAVPIARIETAVLTIAMIGIAVPAMIEIAVHRGAKTIAGVLRAIDAPIVRARLGPTPVAAAEHPRGPIDLYEVSVPYEDRDDPARSAPSRRSTPNSEMSTSSLARTASKPPSKRSCANSEPRTSRCVPRARLVGETGSSAIGPTSGFVPPFESNASSYADRPAHRRIYTTLPMK